MVSKDERELTQSRAELEALLTQQRSASAATVQSEPSTSSQNDSNKVLFLPLQLHLQVGINAPWLVSAADPSK